MKGLAATSPRLDARGSNVARSTLPFPKLLQRSQAMVTTKGPQPKPVRGLKNRAGVKGVQASARAKAQLSFVTELGGSGAKNLKSSRP
jgi:hypothetical protein